MAYDKILVIHARLDKRINYALNGAKTLRTENGQILQTAINCQLDSAYRDMLRTKRSDPGDLIAACFTLAPRLIV